MMRVITKSKAKLLLFFTTLLCSITSYAQIAPARLLHTSTTQHHNIAPIATSSHSNQNLGDIANNIFGAEQGIHGIARTLIICCSVGLIFFGMMQYNKHRKNPIETTLGSVIVTFIIAIILLILAFIPMKFA